MAKAIKQFSLIMVYDDGGGEDVLNYGPFASKAEAKKKRDAVWKFMATDPETGELDEDCVDRVKDEWTAWIIPLISPDKANVEDPSDDVVSIYSQNRDD